MTLMIVAYHAISTVVSPISTPLAQFETDVESLTAHGFTFVGLDECVAWVDRRVELPSRSVAITFDDAYASVLTHALPVLTRRQVPATVFAIAGRLGGDNQWAGQWRSIPPMSLLDAPGLRELVNGGLTIGCHSWSHSSLPEVSDDELQREVIQAADELEQVCGTPVRHFAYPYGRRGQREVSLVATRFASGVSTVPGLLGSHSNVCDLPRVDPHDLRGALVLRVAASPGMRPYLTARRTVRTCRRMAERALGRESSR
jgi:peptidoglycan/xylan/chitin deacetylase (PgdA/CDA1 family)